MKKMPKKLLFVLIASNLVVYPTWGDASDAGLQSLTSTIGATDYFRITCGDNTEHLKFGLIESGGEGTQAANPILPQILNATLTKVKLTNKAAAIGASTTQTLSLKGGDGAYTLSIETVGTNTAIKTAQSYTVRYQCLNAKAQLTTGSSTLAKQGVDSIIKKLANGATAKYIINCAKNTKAGSTDQLTVLLTNKTVVSQTSAPPTQTAVAPLSGNIAAQVVKNQFAINTIGDALDVYEGEGDYDVMINSPVNKAQNYRFQYSCIGKNNVDIPSKLQVLQNQ